MMNSPGVDRCSKFRRIAGRVILASALVSGAVIAPKLFAQSDSLKPLVETARNAGGIEASSATPKANIDVSKRTARYLGQITEYTLSSEATAEAIGFVSSREDFYTEEIAHQLAEVAKRTKSEKLIIATVRCMWEYKKEKLCYPDYRAYDFDKAEESIAFAVSHIIDYTKSEEAAINSINCFLEFKDYPLIVCGDCPGFYEDGFGIAGYLSWIAEYTKSRKAVLDAAACISKFRKYPRTAWEISYRLMDIAKEKNGKDAVSVAARCLSSDIMLKAVSTYAEFPASEYEGSASDWTVKSSGYRTLKEYIQDERARDVINIFNPRRYPIRNKEHETAIGYVAKRISEAKSRGEASYLINHFSVNHAVMMPLEDLMKFIEESHNPKSWAGWE